MTPRLVLLTGPAAGEVAQVFRQMAHGLALRYVTGNGPASTWDEVRDYWDAPIHVACHLDALPWSISSDALPWSISSVLTVMANAVDHLLRDHNCDAHGHEQMRAAEQAARRLIDQPSRQAAIEAAIRSLPGGEAWLVGLVLPEPTECFSCDGNGEHFGDTGGSWPCSRCSNGYASWPCQDSFAPAGPARLAILAPEPPPLLVERVRAWGGEVWECYVSQTGNHVILTERFHGADPGSGCLASGDTWPETVRAALGEVAPC